MNTRVISFHYFSFAIVHGAESDVIRVYDDKLRLTEKEMAEYLKQADLENYGFEKIIEQSTVTDEYGKKTTKKTIYYKVTDDCSNVPKWERVLEQRLPEELSESGIFSKTVKEVQSRIIGRKTKSCTVALEIHPSQCRNKTDRGKTVSKRAAGKRCWINCCNGGCNSCSSVSILYDN
jgi:hypothetical protein